MTEKQLLRKIRKLEEALVFYADPLTYLAIAFIPDPPNGAFMDDMSLTKTGGYFESIKPGKRARKALGIEGKI